MNYYERHLGDYAKDTAHLSMIEHGAYDLLLDRYYATEQGIPQDQAHRVTRARTKEEKAAVDTVLNEFFKLIDGVWRNKRADEEIIKAQAKIKAAQENGKKGGRPGNRNPDKTQQKPNGLLLGSDLITQEKAHQTPDTNSSVDKSTVGKPTKLTPEEIIFTYGVPLLVNAGTAEKQARSFLGGLRKQNGDEKVVDVLRQCVKEKPLQPLEWLAKALPPNGAKSPIKTPAPENFASREYESGML